MAEKMDSDEERKSINGAVAIFSIIWILFVIWVVFFPQHLPITKIRYLAYLYIVVWWPVAFMAHSSKKSLK